MDAAGNLGSLVVAEALSRGQEVVISVIKPAPNYQSKTVAAIDFLMDGLAQAGERWLVVGQAATLTVANTGGKTVNEDAKFLPVSIRHARKASADKIEACRSQSWVDRAYLSPPTQLTPGKPTANGRLGTDELLLDGKGNWMISIDGLAVAPVDEAERPMHHRTRFTVAY